MIDFKNLKSLKIPEGVVSKIVSAGVTLWEAVRLKNWVPFSTESDGKTIYNGGLGYKNNTRLNSSANEVALNGYVTIGFIPVKPGDVIRVKGITWTSDYNTGSYFWYYGSDFAKGKSERVTSGTEDIGVAAGANGEVVFTLEDYISAANCAYIRFSAYGTGENLIVTVNEEIQT